MTLRSAIYVGHVRHRRREPRHAFTFPMFMAYLDLSELDRVFSMTRLWGRSRLCPARFRREDYLRWKDLCLEESVRARVEEQTGHRPEGPIRVLTHLRYFGYNFNPVTFYYCFDRNESLEAVVAEITNTPWGERHSYVLDTRTARKAAPGARALRWKFNKDFHVSPFLPMDLGYDWTFTPPGAALFTHMNLKSSRDGKLRVFDATLVLRRREMTPGLLRGLLVRYPLLTLKVIATIHLHALRLWLKGATVYAHPGHVGSGRDESLPKVHPRSQA